MIENGTPAVVAVQGPPPSPETLRENALRQRLHDVKLAWRFLEALLDGEEDKEVARCTTRMTDALDLLEREWVLRRTR